MKALLGNVAVYWISPAPVEWYIATSAARTSVAPVVFAAALLPLLAAEAGRRRDPVETGAAASPA